MLTKLKRIILTAAAAATLAFPALVPAAVYAQDLGIGNAAGCGTNGTIDPNGNNNCPVDATASGTALSNLIKKIINIFSVIIGVIAVVMIIIGGLKYITSGGDSGNVSSAKNTIIYALVGLVIVALAQFIVHFVLANANAAATGA